MYIVAEYHMQSKHILSHLINDNTVKEVCRVKIPDAEKNTT